MNRDTCNKPTLTDLGGAGIARKHFTTEYQVKLAPIQVQVWDDELEKHTSLEIPKAGTLYVKYLVNARNKLYGYLHLNDTDTNDFSELLEAQMGQVIQQLVGVQPTTTQKYHCESFTVETVYQRAIKAKAQVTLPELKLYRMYMLNVEMSVPCSTTTTTRK